MAGGQRLDGKPTELVNQALKVDPENAKALQLAGSAAFQAQDYKKGGSILGARLEESSAGLGSSTVITARINEAKSLAGSK